MDRTEALNRLRTLYGIHETRATTADRAFNRYSKSNTLLANRYQREAIEERRNTSALRIAIVAVEAIKSNGR